MPQTSTPPLTYGLHIDGRWTEGSATELLSVINPATEEVIGTTPLGTVSDVQNAIKAARQAFDEDLGRACRRDSARTCCCGWQTRCVRVTTNSWR
jgi:hypothetical protein